MFSARREVGCNWQETMKSRKDVDVIFDTPMMGNLANLKDGHHEVMENLPTLTKHTKHTSHSLHLACQHTTHQPSYFLSPLSPDLASMPTPQSSVDLPSISVIEKYCWALSHLCPLHPLHLPHPLSLSSLIPIWKRTKAQQRCPGQPQSPRYQGTRPNGAQR